MDETKIDRCAKYLGISLKGCNTRYEKISKFKSNNIFYIFEYLTIEEKKEFYCYLSNTSLRNEFLSSLEYQEILNLIRRDEEVFDNYDIKRVLDIFDNERDKYKFILDLSDIFRKFSGYLLMDTILTFKDEDYKIKLAFAFHLSNYCLLSIIKSCSDEVKISFFDMFDISSRVDLIKSFNDDNLKKEYALKEEYSNFRSDLVASLSDEEFIINTFKNINYDLFRLNLIEKVESKDLKIKLISLLEDKPYKDVLLTNYVNDFNMKVSDSELLSTKVDESITIGVELECCNKDISYYKCVKRLFNDFNCKGDSSVKSGFEITSPILHYNELDMSKLKSVCELLKKKGFYTDNSCGGHIHIGASYFTSKDDYLMLLYLCSNVEDILYYISDREGSVKRSSIERYAFKSKENYINAIDNGVFSDEEFTFDKMHDMFELVNKTRYNGVNFKNVGSYIQNTIEFRMPNGEIEFSELILNIKLFARLIEVSHKIVVSGEEHAKSMARHLSFLTSEREKLNVLMDLLFDSEEEKELYKKRYYSNKSLEKKNFLKFLKSLRKELFNEEETTIIYDEEEHTLVKKSV